MTKSTPSEPKAIIHQKALQLFEVSLDLPKEAREAWLREQAKEDASLLEILLRMYASDAQHAGLIQTGHVSIESSEDESLPTRIGPYKIVGLIGRGGMGSVYLGDRDSGDFTHQVAIKLIRPGVMSDSLIKRFTLERQTLANLIHPNIARLYDGGQYEKDSPYFVMEYIDGLPITQWVSQNTLNEAARINLFLDACRAVNSAHQNLIIHRDITPSNVLVNQSGEVKLIDFGIAKSFTSAEAQLDDHKTSETHTASLSFTPGFAAPERESGQVATTLVDIYSLGKLLAAMFEGQKMSGELESICACASAGKAEERYPTVNDLMEDLQRYQQNQPVQAYSSRKRYAVKKFVGRHKAIVSLAAFSLCIIVSALAISVYQYQRAESHLNESIARFNQVHELANYQLFDLYDQLSKVAGNTAVRAELAAKAQDYLEILQQSKNASFKLRLDVAIGYTRLARIFGVPAIPNLGDVGSARKSLSSAGELLNDLALKHPNSSAVKIATVENMASQAMILVHDDSDLSKAFEVTETAQSLLSNIPVTTRQTDWYLAQRSLRYSQLERADQSNDTQTLRDLAKNSLQNIEDWPEELLAGYLDEQDKGWFHYWMGLADYLEGQYQSSLEHFEQGHTKLSTLEQTTPNNPMLLYILAWNNYIAYGSAAQLNQTEMSSQFLDRAIEATQKLARVQEGDASIIRLAMQMREAQSQLLATLGQLNEAIEMQEQLVIDQESQAKSKPEASQFETWAFSEIILAYMYYEADNRDSACNSLEHAEELLSPLAEKQLLSQYMMNAAQRLGVRIDQCRGDKPIDSQNALFE